MHIKIKVKVIPPSLTPIIYNITYKISFITCIITFISKHFHFITCIITFISKHFHLIHYLHCMSLSIINQHLNTFKTVHILTFLKIQ
ncbi:hypothetical protein VIGAN_08178600 [Vigna angularis var. angularis]|uniref:Uncharacterized protein n=1 Tax=Vigna angularis var. angularis TaxID=157739 RepID=A0A0S3SQJ7_PHAAN|nr:hypothetical protein VIGAN_08178600 [Vigna angularis var. angularis]